MESRHSVPASPSSNGEALVAHDAPADHEALVAHNASVVAATIAPQPNSVSNVCSLHPESASSQPEVPVAGNARTGAAYKEKHSREEARATKWERLGRWIAEKMELINKFS
jgi:hypothetical protein